MQLYDEFLALKAQLAYFCPRERVDFREVLENDEAGMSYGQLQSDAFVVLYTATLKVIMCKLLTSDVKVKGKSTMFHKRA